MKFADEIIAIANKWAEMGMEVPDSVHVGTNRYKEILREAHDWSTAKFMGASQFKFHSPHGFHTIKCNPNLDPDCIAMGRLTLTDILIEDIILDGDSLDFLDD